MDNIDELTVKFLNDFSALPEDRMRLGLLANRLKSLEPDMAARFFDRLLRAGPNNRPYGNLIALLTDPDSLKPLMGEGPYEDIKTASVKARLKKVSRFFIDPMPQKTGFFGYDKEEEARMEFVTLGQRRAMAKERAKNTIDRLTSDPDPAVIRNLLDNPRITEKEVLKIASRRPASAEILKVVALHRRWSRSYDVLKAIILNPYGRPRVSAALVYTMLDKDIRGIYRDRGLHPMVRQGAGELLKERGGED